jgi:hypothetical protein
MPQPPRYGIQTFVGGAVILMGLGFVGAQLLAPDPSTANGAQQVAARPAPRIIEINTKRPDARPPEDAARVEPAKPLNETVAHAAPAPVIAAPPPISAPELKRNAEAEPELLADTTAVPAREAVSEPRRRSHSRARYPKYDRHAVY